MQPSFDVASPRLWHHGIEIPGGPMMRAPHQQDDGGHDKTFTAHGLMFPRARRRLRQLFGLQDPERAPGNEDGGQFSDGAERFVLWGLPRMDAARTPQTRLASLADPHRFADRRVGYDSGTTHPTTRVDRRWSSTFCRDQVT